MSIGPVEYMVVAFPGNQFNGKMAPALADLVEAGTIRVLDLAMRRQGRRRRRRGDGDRGCRFSGDGRLRGDGGGAEVD